MTDANRTIRVGAVAYLNARPLVHGLERGVDGMPPLQLTYDVPSSLSDRMARGELDVALLPVVELARHPELEVVPGLGISTRGPARSVLLMSSGAPGEARRVALDPESRTTNALVRVLYARVWGRHPEFVEGSVDLERTMRTADAAVRIGDKALFEPRPDGLISTDVGEVWTAETGLPFVFAVWAARPGTVDRSLYRALHASRRAGTAAIDKIATEFVWHGYRDPDAARAYLGRDIRYRLGTAEVRAINLFFEAAAELGVIDRAPRLNMALERWTSCHETAAVRATSGRSDQ